MNKTRLASWLLPGALAGLAICLMVAVLVARTERPSRALLEATPGILSGGNSTPPEIAALNAQLAQISTLRAASTYGPGLTHIVRAPVSGLRTILGEEWHELTQPSGTLTVRPTGPRSRYYQIGAVVVAKHGPTRFVVAAPEGQQGVQAIGTSPFELVNFGPLIAPKTGPIVLTLYSTSIKGNAPGGSLILSPFQSRYLSAGEWVTGMSALAELGPGGVRGIYLKTGSATRFAMTPGIKGPCFVSIRGASVEGPLSVTAIVGREAATATVRGGPRSVTVGPFSAAASIVTLTVSASGEGATRSLFVSDLRFVLRPPKT